jgi:Protein tyrosine and serine/threonine kinase/FG-GAP repeat
VCATGESSGSGLNPSDNDAVDSGACYGFQRNPITGQMVQAMYLKAPDIAVGDKFGHAVSLSGNVLVVSAPFEDSGYVGVTLGPNYINDGKSADSGAVYLYDLESSPGFVTPSLRMVLKPPYDHPGAQFGHSLTLSTNSTGSRVVVGAPYDGTCTASIAEPSSLDCTESGAVFVYDFAATGSPTMFKIKAPTNASGWFGSAVSLVDDTVLIGARYDDTCPDGVSPLSACSKPDSGAAYAYSFNITASTWDLDFTLKQQTGFAATTIGNQLGASVAALSDGVFAAGAPYDARCNPSAPLAPGGKCSNVGSVEIFRAIKPITGPTSGSTTGVFQIQPPATSGASTTGTPSGSSSTTAALADASSSGSSDGSLLLIVVLCVVGGLLLCAALVAAAVFFKKRRASESTASSTSDSKTAVALTAAKKRQRASTVAQHAVAHLLKVKFGEEIGSGSFGTVYDGSWSGSPEGRKKVAIKQISGEEGSDEFMQELDMMLAVSAEHVVRVYGATEVPESLGGGLGIVMQLCARGSLVDVLRAAKESGKSFELAELLQICLHIAEGLQSLHDNNIVHRDLAARNVLVSDDGICMLTDMGLSRRVDPNQVYVATSNIPVRHSAPEVLEHKRTTTASDVYSLAVVFTEVFSLGKEPFSRLDSNMDVVRRVIQDGLRPSRPKGTPDDLWALIESMWTTKAKERPSVSAVASDLQAMVDAEVEREAGKTPQVVDGVYYDLRLVTDAVGKTQEKDYQE